MATTREILKPSETPLIVTLKFDEPLESNSQFSGLQYQYAVTKDGADAVLYLPPIAKQRIDETGARRGDEICIVKAKKGNRNDWQVQKVEEEPTPAEPAPAPNGNAYREPAKPAETQHPGESFPLAEQAAIALRASARACVIVEHEMKAIGRQIAFSEESIRGFAQTIYNAQIGRNGGGK